MKRKIRLKGYRQLVKRGFPLDEAQQLAGTTIEAECSDGLGQTYLIPACTPQYAIHNITWGVTPRDYRLVK